MNVPGGHTGGAPPVPIPNTEVKPSKADVTAAARLWESRTLPGYKKKPAGESQQAFLFCATRSRVLKRVGGLSPETLITIQRYRIAGTSKLGVDLCRVTTKARSSTDWQAFSFWTGRSVQ